MPARRLQLTSPAVANDLVGVVFSKDRPLQLDATLTSLRRHCRSWADLRLSVLYTTSSPAQAWMYRVVGAEHPDVRFVRERQFKRDLIDLVAGSEHLLFLVDDTLVVRDFELLRPRGLLRDRPAALGFSLRLGLNTTYCYMLDQPQVMPEPEQLGNQTLEFRWPGAPGDFGHPLEVSSSLYRTSDIGPLLSELEYRNPNTLEAALARHTPTFATSRDRLLCPETAVAFSIPANLVQDVYRNRVASEQAVSAGALAERYAHGDRLAVAAYDGFTPTGCHQEVEFAYERRTMTPTVSVVIPCFNQAAFLPYAVESVVAQTFPDWEIIIVDDGSPDDTSDVAAALISRFPERRIRLLGQANGGPSRARNAGIAAALGRYILPLDADDMIAPEMLQQTVNLLESDPAIAIAYTDSEEFGSESQVVESGRWSTEALCQRNRLAYCSLYRREVWEATGGYNPSMAHGYEDWDFWIGAARRGYRARRIGAPLFRYRLRPGTRTSSAHEHDRELRAQIRANHPAQFTLPRRAARWAFMTAERVLRRLKRLAGISGRPREADRA